MAMSGRKVVIVLEELDIQEVERAVLDHDAAAALAFLERVIQPGIRKALDKGHCRPVFEWETGDIKAVRPPPLNEPDRPGGKKDA